MSKKMSTKNQRYKRKIRTKKRAYIERKLTENVGMRKEQGKNQKSLGLKMNPSISNINYLENDKCTGC